MNSRQLDNSGTLQTDEDNYNPERSKIKISQSEKNLKRYEDKIYEMDEKRKTEDKRFKMWL